ncbi:PIN domain-containing protein [Candidatus Thiosymbion oneisti]|uniref:PIN domain-containing protein n=1 Tax=Candidatus Thiosymbion oneisti TaxID=589554 RepID=UPI001C40493D
MTPVIKVNIVVDTNVFVGACLGADASNEVIVLCLRGEATPLMGASLLAEYENVLSRDELFNRSRLIRANAVSCSISSCRVASGRESTTHGGPMSRMRVTINCKTLPAAPVGYAG